MKRFILLVVLWGVLLVASKAGAEEEPILVIDPQGHSAMIRDVMFTPDGKTLISVSLDKTIRVWDVVTGDLIKTLRGQIGDGEEGMLNAGSFSPDGNTIAVGGYGSGGADYIQIFNLATSKQIGLLTGHTNVIIDLTFSQDGNWLASGSFDRTVRIWDVSETLILGGIGGGFLKNSPIVTLEGHSDAVYGVAFSPDGKKLVSASLDGTLRLWELPKNLQKKVKSKVMKKHSTEVYCVAFAPNGQYIVSGGADGNVFLWDRNGKFLKKIDQVGEAVATISFSVNSKKIIVSGFPGEITSVYSIPSGKKLVRFTKHEDTVLASAFYKHDLIATTGGDKGDIYIWDASSGMVNTHITSKGSTNFTVAFSRDLKVAFGRIYTEGDGLNLGSLEKSFDFLNMTLNQNLYDESEFTRTQMEYSGKTIKVIDKWTLDVDGKTIKQDTQSDTGIHCYTFTRDGNVVVGSQWSLMAYKNDGTFLRKFVGHTGDVFAVSVSEDGKLLASASNDQTIKLWNLEIGENLATLFVTSDNEWVCWTPQGYYAASAGGEKYIGWHLNQGSDKAAKYYPVSVFRKRFFHPELVKRTIALASFEQALADINAESRQKIEEVAVTDVLPPTIEWISPQETNTNTLEETIRIRAKVHSDREIKEVKVLVNGRAQAAGRGLIVDSQDTALEKTVDQEITLTSGQNIVTIFAANQDAGATSDERIVVYDAEWLKPNVYMVAIGISTYQKSELQLEYADDDAQAISQLFRAQQGKLYKEVTIKELYNADATQDNILAALEWLEKQATQKDIAVIFMAAHGVNDTRGNYYLLPADGDPDSLRRTGVDWRDFADILGNLPSRMLLFLDTCHSGELGQDLFRLRGQMDNTEAIRELASDENGVVILAASTGREYSMEHPDWKHGAFTKALLDGLEQGQADYSQDGIVHLRELDTYISERVKELTDGVQHPTTLKPSTISRFPIVQIR
jgi:WD40 repeat protein